MELRSGSQQISRWFLNLMFFDVFDPSWPTKNLFCDTYGTAVGHFYRFGPPILLPWTPNGNLLGLLWALCAGQFDPPGPMLENCRKTTKQNHFFRITFWSLLWKVAHAIRSRLCSPNTHFTLNSDTFFWASKIAKDSNGVGSQSRHLRHITDKGGTGSHLGAIWEASGRHLGEEGSESRLEAQSQ